MLTAALAAGALMFSPAAPAEAAGTLTQNVSAKTITAASSGTSMTVSYNNQAAITSLLVAGSETLAPGQPGYSRMQLDSDGSTVSSVSLPQTPSVTLSGNSATVSFTMSNTKVSIAEVWTITANTNNVVMTVSRTSTWAGAASGSVRDSSMPQLTFKQNQWNNAHMAQSGGSIPLWGSQLVTASAAQLTDGSAAFPSGLSLEKAGNRVIQNQNQLRLLNDGTTGLDVSAAPNRNGAISFLREGTSTSPAGLTTSWSQSNAAWSYTNMNPKGYAEPAVGLGRFATGGALLFAPASVSSGQQDTVSLTFSSTPTSDSYNVGTIKGFDSNQVAHAIKDFGAAMMQDSTIGASSERSFRSAKAAPFTMLFNVYAAELLQNNAAFQSLQKQFLDVKDGLQRADGMLGCCTPFAISSIPSNLPDYLTTDGVFAYVAAVATLYELYPDPVWLQQMKPSIEAALSYADNHLKVTTGITSGLYSNYQCGQPAPLTGCVKQGSDWNDLYQIGQVDAYQNVLAYHALTQWAGLESSALSNPPAAASYTASAATLRNKFNQAGANGGFWSPASQTFEYTRDTNGTLVKDCKNLFANGYAVQYGLVNDDRARLLTGQLRSSYYRTFWRLHGSNPVSCATTESNLYFPYFEDGGVHLLMEQPAAQIGLTLADRSYNVNYAHTVAERFPQDNFWGMSNIQPDTLNVRRDVYQETWMSNNILGLWPLFHDVLGFQPTPGGLDLVPYIDNTLIGSSVPYSVRGQHPVTVAYQALETYQVTADGTVPIRIGWRDRQAGASYTVRIDGIPQAITADISGEVWVAAAASGTHTYTLNTTTSVTLDDSKASYAGTWGPAAGSAFFGGSIALSSAANSAATFDFTGDTIGFTGSTGTDKGQAKVTVDGINLGAVDYYSTSPQNQKTIFSQSGFGPGAHRLTITALGIKNTASTGTQINVDAFLLPGTPATSNPVDDVHFAYSGAWFTDQYGGFLDGTIHGATTAGATATKIFSGTSVVLIGSKGSDKGKAQISIDGSARQTVDFYASSGQNQATVATITGLTSGTHTLVVTALGQKSAASTGTQINVDGILVTKPTPPQTVPALQSWTASSGAFVWGVASRVVVDPAYATQLSGDANTFATDLSALEGRSVAVATGAAGAGDILLTLGGSQPAKGYTMTVGDSISIQGSTTTGEFWGTRTVLQMLHQSPTIPAGTASDAPTKPERGLMIDTGRNFFPVPWVENQIRDMSYLKLNYLQLHLSDNFGFRLESSTHPEITSAQHYSKQDIANIIAVANQYHVIVVPEIDMPGHMDAILSGELSIGKDYRLKDSSGNISSSYIDLSIPGARTLISDLINEYLPLFNNSPYWHLGADEYVTNYSAYPQILTYAQQNYGPNATAKDTYYGFVNWADSLVRAGGNTMRMWNDGIRSGDGTLTVNPDIIVEVWTNAGLSPQQLIDAGHTVANESWTPTYYVYGGMKPDTTWMYQSWNPDLFNQTQTINNTTKNLGSLIHVWCDNPSAETLDQTAAGIKYPLRDLAQMTWGSPKPVATYAAFVPIMDAVGRNPLWPVAIAGDLAEGKPTTASSVEPNTSFTPDLATDGYADTRWSSDHVDPSWLQVDLGSVQTVNRVVLAWEAAYGKNYQIQMSNDGTTWTTVYTRANGTGGTETLTGFIGTGRYIRMNGTARGTQWGYSLWSFQVYGT